MPGRSYRLVARYPRNQGNDERGTIIKTVDNTNTQQYLTTYYLLCYTFFRRISSSRGGPAPCSSRLLASEAATNSRTALATSCRRASCANATARSCSSCWSSFIQGRGKIICSGDGGECALPHFPALEGYQQELKPCSTTMVEPDSWKNFPDVDDSCCRPAVDQTVVTQVGNRYISN